MGCTSSTEVDTHTGKPKKKFGGDYPGNRRPQQAPYAPPQEEFQKVDGNTTQATAHFVSYGGGNALVLVNDANSPPQAASGGPAKEYISVTLPDGVNPGDTIHVQSPDGRLNEIVVPDGMHAGSTFTVEFAGAPKPPPTAVPVAVPAAAASSATGDDFVSGFNAPPASRSRPSGPDDGFVSGFSNPNSVQVEPDVNVNAPYPTAPASYTSKPY